MYPDGAQFIGEYKAGKEHGVGSFIFKDGTRQVGKWENGENKTVFKKKEEGATVEEVEDGDLN